MELREGFSLVHGIRRNPLGFYRAIRSALQRLRDRVMCLLLPVELSQESNSDR